MIQIIGQKTDEMIEVKQLMITRENIDVQMDDSNQVKYYHKTTLAYLVDNILYVDIEKKVVTTSTNKEGVVAYVVDNYIEVVEPDPIDNYIGKNRNIDFAFVRKYIARRLF